jgi:hypothetical protein
VEGVGPGGGVRREVGVGAGDAGQACDKEAGQNRWARWRGHPDAGGAHVVGRVGGREGRVVATTTPPTPTTVLEV